MRKISFLFGMAATLLLTIGGCTGYENRQPQAQEQTMTGEIPEYSGEAYVELNGNIPEFTEEEKKSTEPFERYSELDELGRCGIAYANICDALLPTEERGKIGQVKPSGWHTVKYASKVEGNYLYNRCHLIGYQLAGENANEKNLVTGTRYLNTVGMLPFENQVADYVKNTGNHVLYRVTPIFEGNDLVASGIQMEAWSVEDAGQGICFNVYCYNVQPGIEIDYETGDSWETEENREETGETEEEEKIRYVLNLNSKKFHLPDCSSVADIAEENKSAVTETAEHLEEWGFTPCKRCLDRR